jgi:hypothetical protein
MGSNKSETITLKLYKEDSFKLSTSLYSVGFGYKRIKNNKYRITDQIRCYNLESKCCQ